MFDRAHYPVRLFQITSRNFKRACKPQNRQVIRLRKPGGKNNLPRLASQLRRNTFPRFAQRIRRRNHFRMNCAGIPSQFTRLIVCPPCFGAHRRSTRVIKIYSLFLKKHACIVLVEAKISRRRDFLYRASRERPVLRTGLNRLIEQCTAGDRSLPAKKPWRRPRTPPPPRGGGGGGGFFLKPQKNWV